MIIKKQDAALLVFSAGQDSTTLLFYAMSRFERVECISFFYGQNHSIELEQAKKITSKFNLKHTIIDIGFLNQITDSALNSGGDINKQHDRMKNLPASWVPNRNMIFMTLATTYAQKVGIKNIITGVGMADYSGYPDCRHSFITSLQDTLNYSTYGFDINPQTLCDLILNKGFFNILKEGREYIDLIIQSEHQRLEIKNFFGFEDSEIKLEKSNVLDRTLMTIYGLDNLILIHNFLKERDEIAKSIDNQHKEERSHYVDAKDFLENQSILKNITTVSKNPHYQDYINIITPLMYLDKADIFELAEKEGGLETVLQDSLTCYKGDTTMNAWGMGCGDCKACELRKKGYAEFLRRKKN